MREIRIEFPEFPTHVKLNDPKTLTTRQKWLKIGYNKLYSGVHFTVRSKLINQMHEYILKHIPKDIGAIDTPVETILELHAPLNYGNVKLLYDKAKFEHKLSWKKPSKDFVPTWDLDNLVAAWIKAINDCIQKRDIVPDDNVQYINKKTEEFIPCEDISDRKLVLIIKSRK
jgi:hypothetical protein